MNEAMTAEPPYDMNGSGMPVIGMIPMVIPMFSKIWNANIASTPIAHQRAEEVGRQQGDSPQPPDQQRVEQRAACAPPTKPSSSPTAVKMKSVCCSGTKPFLVCDALAEARRP